MRSIVLIPIPIISNIVLRVSLPSSGKIVAIAEGAVPNVPNVPNVELQEPPVAGGAAVDLETLAMEASKRCRQERAAAALLRPGVVYGFDGNPIMVKGDGMGMGMVLMDF